METERTRRSTWGRRLLLLFAAMVAALLALLFALRGLAADAPQRRALVAVRTLEAGPHALRLPEKVGVLEAAASLDLGFEVAGRVERILGEGARVGEGMEIAALDSALEEAELRRAELLLQEADSELTRMRGLVESNAASAKALESAGIAVGLRRAERDAARERLERRSLHARFAGVLANVEVEPGEVATPGQTIATLLNFDLMSLEVGVPGHQVGAVSPGAQVDVGVPALAGATFEGTLHRVAPATANADALFEVEILVPNVEGPLKPGMSARAAIVTRRIDDALVVPLECVVERAGERVVFFVEDHHARAVPVAGAPLEGDSLVLPGSLPYRTLVVRGQHDLEDAMPVRVDDTVISGLRGGRELGERGVRPGVVAR